MCYLPEFINLFSAIFALHELLIQCTEDLQLTHHNAWIFSRRKLFSLKMKLHENLDMKRRRYKKYFCINLADEQQGCRNSCMWQDGVYFTFMFGKFQNMSLISILQNSKIHNSQCAFFSLTFSLSYHK